MNSPAIPRNEEASGCDEAAGLWEPEHGRIVVKRSLRASLQSFAGTVLRAVAHAVSGTPDINLGFELALTEELDRSVGRQLRSARARR